jgi:hypothetical protein
MPINNNFLEIIEKLLSNWPRFCRAIIAEPIERPRETGNTGRMRGPEGAGSAKSRTSS